ncbi:tetratricopeptide repeat protein, partial [bacterium]|nr:tetratricopeptide repeat protein [bacterium]
PGFEKVRMRQAQVLARAGHTERALDVLRPLLARHPDSFDCNFLQAQILITMGRSADALRPLAVCMERSPEPKVFLLTGIALSLKGDFSEAERFLRAVLDRFPTDPLTQLWLIACTLQRDATAAAAEYRARFLLGVPPDRVAEAIDKALTDGFMPDGTREHITRWIVDAASKHARSSKS